MSIFEKVREEIAEQLALNPEEILLESRLKEDLGADSLDIPELLIKFEDFFGINIPDESAKELKKVRDVVEYIEKNFPDKPIE